MNLTLALPWPVQVAADDMLTVKMSGGETMTDVAPVVLCTVLGKAGVPPEAFVSPDDEGCFVGNKGEIGQDWTLHEGRSGRQVCGIQIWNQGSIALPLGLSSSQPCSNCLIPCVCTPPPDAPALQATHIVDQGSLYPLERGFFFVEKPALCILHKDVQCFEMLRTEAINRVSTLVLHLRPKAGTGSGEEEEAARVTKKSAAAGNPIEFTFDQSEAGRMLTYLENRKIKVRK